jgi:hypothetical protein
MSGSASLIRASDHGDESLITEIELTYFYEIINLIAQHGKPIMIYKNEGKIVVEIVDDHR